MGLHEEPHRGSKKWKRHCKKLAFFVVKSGADLNFIGQKGRREPFQELAGKIGHTKFEFLTEPAVPFFRPPVAPYDGRVLAYFFFSRQRIFH